jgi:hypothetical protein
MSSISSMPESRSSSIMKSIEGLVTSGSISFGMLFVTGNNRVPYPAARITAFNIPSSDFSLLLSPYFPKG